MIRVSCNQRARLMGISMAHPKTGHITCYRTGQLTYSPQATGRRLERRSIGIMIYIITVDYGEPNARFEVGK